MGHPVRGDPFNHAIYRHQNPTKSCREKLWILNTLPVRAEALYIFSTSNAFALTGRQYYGNP